MLLDASVTNALVTFATHLVQHLGLWGIALSITISQLVIVPGTEVTMLFGGFNVDTHHLTLLGIIIAGVVGDVIGGSLCYAIGYFGLHEVLSRKGPLHVDEHKIELTHRWFERYGSPVVAVSRCIPVFRSAPPYAAGIAKMPYWRFLLMATIGSAVWITAMGLVGKAVGSQWQQWKSHLDIVDYVVVVLIVLAVAWWLVRFVRARRRRGAGAHAEATRADA